MICERTITYSLFSPYSIYFRMAAAIYRVRPCRIARMICAPGGFNSQFFSSQSPNPSHPYLDHQGMWQFRKIRGLFPVVLTIRAPPF